MKILAVDTATASCSVAVMEDSRIVAELNFDHPQTHSRHLMGMMISVLELCGLTPDRLDAAAITRGPGSFTGLRIGLATVKGLAAGVGIPVVGVSTLHTLAAQSAVGSRLICRRYSRDRTLSFYFNPVKIALRRVIRRSYEVDPSVFLLDALDAYHIKGSRR